MSFNPTKSVSITQECSKHVVSVKISFRNILYIKIKFCDASGHISIIVLNTVLNSNHYSLLFSQMLKSVLGLAQ